MTEIIIRNYVKLTTNMMCIKLRIVHWLVEQNENVLPMTQYKTFLNGLLTESQYKETDVIHTD